MQNVDFTMGLINFTTSESVTLRYLIKVGKTEVNIMFYIFDGTNNKIGLLQVF